MLAPPRAFWLPSVVWLPCALVVALTTPAHSGICRVSTGNAFFPVFDHAVASGTPAASDGWLYCRDVLLVRWMSNPYSLPFWCSLPAQLSVECVPQLI